MNGLDIQGVIQIVQALVLFLAGGLIVAAYLGWREIQLANQIPFYDLRRQRTARGWRLLFFAILLAILAVTLQIVKIRAGAMIPAETPSEIVTQQDAGNTITPTYTATTEATEVVEATSTPSGTPVLPAIIRDQFDEIVTPDPRAVFGPIHVATEVDYPAYPDDETLETAAGVLYGLFSYDYVNLDVQWTAVWMKDWEIICLESKPWDGEIGGWGYTECELVQWTAGSYRIHIFLGEDWKVSTEFTILGTTDQPDDFGTSTSSPSP